jgi:hypothetical protein
MSEKKGKRVRQMGAKVDACRFAARQRGHQLSAEQPELEFH